MCYVHNQWYDISCATLYFGLHVSCPTILPHFNQILVDFRESYQYDGRHGNLTSESRANTCGQTDIHADTAQVTGAFRG